MPRYRPNSRRKCRYLVEWQRDDFVCTGFTHDISPTGMFVRSAYIPDIGASVGIRLLVRPGERLRLRGTVVRSIHVPPNLRRYVPGGFCVRLDEAPEEYFELLATLFSLRFAKVS